MKPHRLLIDEDDIILVMDLEALLAAMGFRMVDIASTGAAAIAAAVQHQPDLIRMDIRLSGDMDGIAGACEIRRLHDSHLSNPPLPF